MSQKPALQSPLTYRAARKRRFQRAPPALTAPMPCLFPSDGHIYSELPASVRSERGLPREPGLVLCSPDCPSGGKVPTLTYPIPSGLTLACLWPCSYIIHPFISAYLFIHTWLWVQYWDSTDEPNIVPSPEKLSPVKEKDKYLSDHDVVCSGHWHEGGQGNMKDTEGDWQHQGRLPEGTG